MDCREEFISKFEELTDDKNLVNDLIVLLKDYSIQKLETNVVVYDDFNSRCLKKYLATKRIEGKSERTINRYNYELKKMFDILGISVKDINSYHLRYCLGIKKKNGSQGRTIDGVRKVYSSFFKWLSDEGYIMKNPCGALKAVKYRKDQKKLFHLLS